MSIQRMGVGGGKRDRLYFAQVREDPLLEIEALRPVLGGRIVTIGSGGCTALSLLAAGSGEVVAIDLNRTQNDLTELKTVALSELGADGARVFLGATPGTDVTQRLGVYSQIRAALSPSARGYWDGRLIDIRRGVLGAGVSERFIRLVVQALRVIGRGPRRLRRLLACATLDEQRRFYRREWDSIAWRALVQLLLSRRRLTRVYDRAFFERVENDSFGDHFLHRIEHGLTALPTRTNYFLHHMVTGAYPSDSDDGLPPYLTTAGSAAVMARRDHLSIVDGGLADYLAEQPDSSVGGFAISNICEWLDPTSIDALFREIARTAVPGAVVCIRNFLGWTEIPSAWRDVIVEDRARGTAMIARDRSLLQRRFVPCTVHKEAS